MALLLEWHVVHAVDGVVEKVGGAQEGGREGRAVDFLYCFVSVLGVLVHDLLRHGHCKLVLSRACWDFTYLSKDLQ